MDRNGGAESVLVKEGAEESQKTVRVGTPVCRFSSLQRFCDGNIALSEQLKELNNALFSLIE